VVGGPAVFPPIAKVLEGGQADFDGNRQWTVSKDKADWNRRSIYIFSRRSLPYPLLQNFDPANPSQAHHKRDVTTTPLQALTLFNSDIVVNWSQALAGRIINEAGKDETAQLSRLYQILFPREPNKTELAALKAFLAKEESIVQKKVAGKFEAAVPTGLKDPSASIRCAARPSWIWCTPSPTPTISPTASEPQHLKQGKHHEYQSSRLSAQSRAGWAPSPRAASSPVSATSMPPPLPN
jgi:hypothetical protein